MRQRFQKTMGGSGATTDRSSAAMKIPNLDTARIGYASNFSLRAVQRPLAGQKTRVFVTVAIAKHDLLHREPATPNFCLDLNAPLNKRVLQIPFDNIRCSFQILDCFKQGNHMDFGSRPFWSLSPETDFA